MERRRFLRHAARAAAALATGAAALPLRPAAAAEVEVTLATPQDVDARARSNGTIEVTWKRVPEALAYAVQRRAPDDDAWRTIATVYQLAWIDQRGPYVDAEVTAGVRYRYRVRALSALARSDWSDTNASIALARSEAPESVS